MRTCPVLLPVLLVLAVLCSGCGSSSQSTADGRLPVAVSIPPQASLVERLGGDTVAVQILAPAGTDPHSHQLSDQDVARLMRCQAYFRTGVPFENGAWFQALVRTRGPRVVDLRGEDADPHAGHHQHDHDHHHHDHTGEDPHIWLDPADLQRQARLIADTLVALDPQHQAGYRAREAALQAELLTLEQDLQTRLEPYRGRAFAVYHPAWGVFAETYGLRQLAVEVGGQEPTDAELTALQQQLREAGVSTIFVQPQIQGRSAKRVAEALGLDLVTLDPLAPDPVANLRAVADALIASWE